MDLKELEENNQIKIAVIGAGDYGLGLLCQLEEIEILQTSLVVDKKIEKALDALDRAGTDTDRVVSTNSISKINELIENGKIAVAEDITLVPDIDIDVVVDCTGSVEAGARLAYDSIRNGKHVIEVNVEMDVVVGPILNSIAEEVGVVYTLADGDQPSLIAGLVKWAQDIGLEVIMAGKGTSLFTEKQIEDRMSKNPDISWATVAYLDGTKSQIEMTSVANITGLIPDKQELHRPRATLEEAIELFAPREHGGIMENKGIVDLVNCLSEDGRIIEPRLSSGVFCVVTAKNQNTLKLMHDKGVIMSKDGQRGLLYRPYHLCGIETPTSILYAYLLGLPTGAPSSKPVADVVAVAKTDCPEGTILDGIGGKYIRGVSCISEDVQKNNYLPLGLANKVKLKKAIQKGTFITRDMLEGQGKGFIWQLRNLQEEELMNNSEKMRIRV